MSGNINMETRKHIIHESKLVTLQHSKQCAKTNEFEIISMQQEFKCNAIYSESVEKIIRYSDPPTSFLYRNKKNEVRRHRNIHNSKNKFNSSYVPMDIGIPKLHKERKISKIHDYIQFDFKKYSIFPAGHKNEPKFDDRGYYALKNASNQVCTNKSDEIWESINFGKRKNDMSLDMNEQEEHFYEDLNLFPDISTTKAKRNFINFKKMRLNSSSKINDIIGNIKFPIQPSKLIRKSNTVAKKENTLQENENFEENKNETELKSIKNKADMKIKAEKEFVTSAETTSNSHIYENKESTSGLYDSIETGLNKNAVARTGRFEIRKVSVEEYLEPIQAHKDYTDVMFKEKDGSLVTMIVKMFENSFGFYKKCEKTHNTTNGEQETKKLTISNPIPSEPLERPLDNIQKWNCNLKADVKTAMVEVKSKVVEVKTNMADIKTNMADRPLPVPVESEFYYMEVDRLEAAKLLEGQPDGTFILRPSSQPFHAYTISLAYRGTVHNVGVRRRSDGRLALGFTKRSEQSFATVTQLVEHHYLERLLLIADGRKIGSTQLRKIHD